MRRAGNLLSRERVKRKLSLDEVAQATKIKENFLAAIERGEYTELPSPAYAEGFVRNYAEYLGLPKTEILALFRREFDEKKAYKVLPDVLVKSEEFPLKGMRIQQSFFAVGCLLLLIIGYLFFQYRSSYMPPFLSVSFPQQNSSTGEEVTVKGKVDGDSTVLVNDQPVSVNPSGDFTKVIALFPGKSTITIKAQNRMGKETIVTRDVMVK